MSIEWDKRTAAPVVPIESELCLIKKLSPGTQRYIIEAHPNWDIREASILLHRVLGPHFILVPHGGMPAVMELTAAPLADEPCDDPEKPKYDVTPSEHGRHYPGTFSKAQEIVRLAESFLPASGIELADGSEIKHLVEALAAGIVTVYG